MKNEKNISITTSGHGHYRIKMEVYNDIFATISTNSIAVDDYNDWDNERRHNRGYKALYQEIMREYRAFIKSKKGGSNV